MELLSNEQVYPSYKPLRNALRKVELRDSLVVLWNYAENLALNRRIDCTQEVPTQFRYGDRTQKRRVFPEWEIETLAREVVINSPVGTATGLDSFQRLACLSRCANKLKSLEEEIFRLHCDRTDMLVELHRMAHRQFVWSTYGPSHHHFLRYAKLYAHSDLKPLVERCIGLSLPDYWVAGLALFSYYLSRPALAYPPRIDGIPGLTAEMVERVISAFSMPLDDLRDKLEEERQFSENFAYGYSSLRAYPIIRMPWFDGQPHVVCPMPILLMWALTQGVYYRLTDEAGWDQALGRAYQAYVGEVIEAANGGSYYYEVIPEAEYPTGKGHQRTVDWILAEPGAALLIECKAKRLRREAKENIASLEEVQADLTALANAVVQVYKSMRQYELNKYPTLPFDETRRIYPVVVTMEEWYVMGDRIAGYVREKVKEGLEQAGIDPGRILEAPYTICSTSELELLMPVLRSVPIADVMEPWGTNPEYRDWSFDPYLRNNYPDFLDGRKPLFPNEFLQLFPSELRNGLVQH